MKKSELIKFLTENDLSDVEELKYKDNITVSRFFYDFDKEEIEAAKAYSNEESDYDAESDEWYSEYFIPYLSDIAIDNVNDIIEDTTEEFEVEAQFVSFDVDVNNYQYSEFIAIFYDEDNKVDLDEVLDDLGL
ncbi:hypothetical protein CPJCM30710_22450 [Clostridium polyendosporum]|uniref:Uncharacterized protein n=1 Tax=Clostridium polyendosporum TaxID=69208 RepID=A0A919VEV2_9CLOT|nr:hypothetical protein [Clostridium polyendosporum]GIM29579.1 hypothetical protein CPJCM30710_22450 [Clostridium polyendosporum]